MFQQDRLGMTQPRDPRSQLGILHSDNRHSFRSCLLCETHNYFHHSHHDIFLFRKTI
jgi:hypothetical protein